MCVEVNGSRNSRGATAEVVKKRFFHQGHIVVEDPRAKDYNDAGPWKYHGKRWKG